VRHALSKYQDTFWGADKALRRRRNSYAHCIVGRFRIVGSCAAYWAVEGQCVAKEKNADGGGCSNVTASVAQTQYLEGYGIGKISILFS
jgi:hypothetical protein